MGAIHAIKMVVHGLENGWLEPRRFG